MQQLTEEERKILEGRYLEGYRFIARDYNGILEAYLYKPRKSGEGKYWETEHAISLIDLIHDSEIHFKFIKWEDDEPYEIEKLLDIKDGDIDE